MTFRISVPTEPRNCTESGWLLSETQGGLALNFRNAKSEKLAMTKVEWKRLAERNPTKYLYTVLANCQIFLCDSRKFSKKIPFSLIFKKLTEQNPANFLFHFGQGCQICSIPNFFIQFSLAPITPWRASWKKGADWTPGGGGRWTCCWTTKRSLADSGNRHK